MGGTPLCPSIIARYIAILIVAELHPLGAQKSGRENPISIALTNAIPIPTEEDSCPATIQPYTRTHRILRKLAPLWEHNVQSWAQTVRLAPNARPLRGENHMGQPPILWQNP